MYTTGSGPIPGVLCHATGFCGAVLGPLARAVPNLRAAAPDLRGHGDNAELPPSGVDWRLWADDALAGVAALRAEGLDGPVVGFGHSGGGAALLLAEQQEPGTFAALYLYEPVVFSPERLSTMTGGNPLAGAARKRRPDFPSRDDALANFASKAPMDVFDREVLEAYIDHGFARRPDGSVTLKCRPDVEASCYEMAPHSGAWTAVPSIRCPVVVARGNLSSGGPAMFAEHTAAALPDGALETYDHLDHFGPLEAPEEIGAAFERLVKQR